MPDINFCSQRVKQVVNFRPDVIIDRLYQTVILAIVVDIGKRVVIYIVINFTEIQRLVFTLEIICAIFGVKEQ